ncbi:negative transcriptional regulator, PaiB family [Agrococcus jejuensis]|uniref:Negative transcriptional regulator, PaiB family n=2 Tax=Agrococcus jejuensis TaxID=399736 RepID=A0A1G8AYT6_9MICO|nr:negative transcriptional regulator, PaiB family [Agrococcus jejuensis]
MQPNPQYRVDDPAFVRTLVGTHPWATVVSHVGDAPVASHTPLLLDETPGANDGDALAFVTHLGRADARLHGLVGGAATGRGTMLVVIQGDHDYVSPSWYLGADDGQVPTWNFEAVHAVCDVEVVSHDENVATLERLVAHFEGDRPGAKRLDVDDETNLGLSMGTTGLRLTVRSWSAKSKMSQNKSPETRANVIAHLRGIHPGLADRMQASLDADLAATPTDPVTSAS